MSGFTTLLVILFCLGFQHAGLAQAQDRALIVAIDSHEDSRISGIPAGTAKNDAEAMQKLLVEKLGFKAEEIKVLRNEQATKAAILSAFDSWLNPRDGKNAKGPGRQLVGLDESGALRKNKKKKKSPKKKKKRYTPPAKVYRSYFYFAGNGYYQPDHGNDEADGLDETLVPYDAKISGNSASPKLTGMISDDEFAERLWKFKNRDVTLILDTSHSGVVTRSSNLAARDTVRMRVPKIAGNVRNITADAALPKHKRENAFVTVRIPGGSLNVWSAASPGQTALIAGEDNSPQGLFTLLFVEGLQTGKADINENGIISNAELLQHVDKASAEYCIAFNERCEMGLRPRLDPPQAYGKSAWVNRKKVSRSKERKLTLSRLHDFIGKQEDPGIEITQEPPSPVEVGVSGIRYEVKTPISGYMLLLNLTNDGKLFQLFPNQFTSSDENGFAGAIKANTLLKVPDEKDGVKFSATEPDKGVVVALTTSDPVKFDHSVTGRVIASVSPNEAIGTYLARLSAALNYPLNTDTLQANTKSARWTVKILPYEVIAPKKPKVP